MRIRMNERCKTITLASRVAFGLWGGYKKKNIAGIVIVLFLYTNGLFASTACYPASYQPAGSL